MTATSPQASAEASGRTYRQRGLRVGPIGLRIRFRAVVGTLLGALVIVGGLAYAVFTTTEFPAARVWAALSASGTPIEELLILDYAFGRAASAALIGAMLGIAGALTQSITRNPIASPDILGISAGAGAAATAMIILPTYFAGSVVTIGTAYLVPAALGGALLTTAIIMVLSWRGGFEGMRLILVGIAMNAVATAISTYLIRIGDDQAAESATRWLIGSVASTRYADLSVLLPITIAGIVGALLLARGVASLRLGREVAASVGVAPSRTEGLALLLAVLLTASAVALAGPIAFVAFVAPQAALRIFRTPGPPLLASALTGALLLLLADQVVQTLPVTLPVGIMTAVVGAPALLYIVLRSTRRSSV